MPIRRDSRGRFAGGGGGGGGGRRQAGSGRVGGKARGSKGFAAGRAKSRLNRKVGNQTGRLVSHNGTVSRVGSKTKGVSGRYALHPVRAHTQTFAGGSAGRQSTGHGYAGKSRGKTAGLAMATTVGSRRSSGRAQLRAKLGGTVGHARKTIHPRRG